MTTTSIQMGSPTEDFPSTSNLAREGAQMASARVSGGSISLNVEGETTVRGSASTINTADMIGEDGGLVCRSATGSPRSAASLTADDIVTVAGQEMKVALAERLGFISKDASGRWSETGSADEVGKEAPQAAPEDTGEALADVKAETALAGLCESVTGTTQVSVLHQIVSEGTVSMVSLQRAASEAGIHPSQMAATINAVHAGFEAQAFSTIKALGSDDPQRFINWAHEARPGEMRKAMMDHAMNRTTAGYSAMYGAYVESIADSNPQGVLDAEFGSGITAERVGGVVVLNIPGQGQVSYKAAVKTGLVKVRGA
jgi:hypothetical protein